MDISRDGRRSSTFATCVAAAADYGLTAQEAADIVDHQVTTIRDAWDDAADVAQLTSVDRAALFGRQILNAYAFTDEGLKRRSR
jgi:serine/threonine-protein kinase HipA